MTTSAEYDAMLHRLARDVICRVASELRTAVLDPSRFRELDEQLRRDWIYFLGGAVMGYMASGNYELGSLPSTEQCCDAARRALEDWL